MLDILKEYYEIVKEPNLYQDFILHMPIFFTEMYF